MNAQQLAALYAVQIKDGELTRSDAIMFYRNRHQIGYIEALEAVDTAIGNLNEYGHSWRLLTEIDLFSTL